MDIDPSSNQGVLVKRFITALTLAVFAFPTAVFAMPDEPSSSGSPIASRVHHVAPDQRAPDQRTPRDLPARIPASGTDVAAPDQQSSVHGTLPAPTSAASEFDWTDAGIGAAVATGLLALSLAGGITVRRRQQRSSALAG
jgi:hypothetical protein